MEAFHPLVRDWFDERFAGPTAIQEKTWPVVAEGRHALIIAPTGSGKTLAAFLWALNQLVTGGYAAGGVRVLYVSPLRALGADVHRNLLLPLGELRELFRLRGEPFPDIRILIRSGDTPASERRRMLSRPPERHLNPGMHISAEVLRIGWILRNRPIF